MKIMDRNKNYYSILGDDKNSEKNKIKKAYYKLSFKFHPDANKGEDINKFKDIAEAYGVLSDEEVKKEYDLKSKWGNNYNEYFELFDLDFDYDHDKSAKKREDFKKNEINNIYIDVGDDFDGNVEYERWVKCNKCDGTGKDLSSNIIIRDNDGNITKIFDAEDGCDFCEGSGKDPRGNECAYCNGKGKIGLTACPTCNGEKRILGKQKLKNIKLEGELTKVSSMGHYSKNGTVGHLYLKN